MPLLPVGFGFRSLLSHSVFFYFLFFYDLTFKYFISAQPKGSWCPHDRANSEAQRNENKKFCEADCIKKYGTNGYGYCQGTMFMHSQHSPKCLCPRNGHEYSGNWEATRDKIEWNCVWDHETRFLMQQTINAHSTFKD